jgi:hypothetical protein
VSSDESLEQIRERAALYALGLLPADEAQRVAACLAAGDARYLAEVAACRSVADDLAYAARPAAPQPAARARVLARIAAAEAPVLEQDGVRFVRGAQLDWQAGPIADFETKALRVDEAGGRITLLARLAPGGVYPSHRHRGVEEIYLVEGDLLINGVLMRSGDSCSADADSVHDGIRSPSGCVFVVTANAADEFLA